MEESFMKIFGEWLKNKIHKIFNKKEDEKVNINVNGSNNNINVINGGKEIMDLIAKCKYCGKEFLDKDNFDFQEDCILHEAIGHLDLKEKFKTITEKAIHMLNKKYNIQAYYEDIEINPDYNECCDCLRDELCGIKCTFDIYFDKNIKSYIGISIDFDSLENDLDINELIKNMEVDYKRYINDKLKPKKKITHAYDFFQLKDEYGNMRLVFVDNNTKEYFEKLDKEIVGKFNNIMNKNINYYEIDKEEQNKVLDKIIDKFYNKLTEKEKKEIKRKCIESLNKGLGFYFTEKVFNLINHH